MHGQTTKLQTMMDVRRVKGTASLISNVNFLPNSETIITVETAHCFNNINCIIQALPISTNSALLVAAAVIIPHQNRALCKIMNPTNKRVYLKKKYRIVRLEAVDIT